MALVAIRALRCCFHHFGTGSDHGGAAENLGILRTGISLPLHLWAAEQEAKNGGWYREAVLGSFADVSSLFLGCFDFCAYSQGPLCFPEPCCPHW